MREMTATETARNFSAVLDQAEHGETIVVTRGGQRIATIAPAPRSNGRAVREVLARWQHRADPDSDLAERVAAGSAADSGELDGDPWHD